MTNSALEKFIENNRLLFILTGAGCRRREQGGQCWSWALVYSGFRFVQAAARIGTPIAAVNPWLLGSMNVARRLFRSSCSPDRAWLAPGDLARLNFQNWTQDRAHQTQFGSIATRPRIDPYTSDSHKVYYGIFISIGISDTWT